MWHPLRLAEDFAMADALTGGRVAFGVGRGYHTREVETFGAPLRDQAGNRELFEEQVEIIFKAFDNAAFSHQGRHYTIPARVPYRGYDLEDLTLVPRPVHPVECWQPIQSATPRGLDFMAKHGIKGIIGGGVAEGGAMRAVDGSLPGRRAPHRPRRAARRGPLRRLSLPARATRRRRPSRWRRPSSRRTSRCSGRSASCARSPTRRSTPWPIRGGRRTAGLPAIEDAVKNGAYLCGPPSQIIDTLMRLEQEYPGLDRVSVSHPMGAPESLMLEQLEWFAAEVMPAFTKR